MAWVLSLLEPTINTAPLIAILKTARLASQQKSAQGFPVSPQIPAGVAHMTQGLWPQPPRGGKAGQAPTALTVGTGHRIPPGQAGQCESSSQAEEGVMRGLPLADREDLQCAHVMVLEPP